LGLLWLIGNAMRLSILAVPPVIPALRDELGLSGTDIGILTGLPVVLFAAAALVGSRLVARLGVITAVVSGLMLTALGSALRGVAPDVMTLFAATALMGIGVAVTQPALPALVGQWLPRHIALGTGTYTNGLLVGEIVPVALFPILLPLLGGSWRATFVLWAVPIMVIALLVMTVAPREASVRVAGPPRWWPDWPAREILRLGVIFAGASALYYGSNAFLPGYLAGTGRSDLVRAALRAQGMAVRALGSALCRQHCAYRGHRERGDRGKHSRARLCHRRGVCAWAHSASAFEHNGRSRPSFGGDVHDQLFERDARVRHRRRRLGSHQRGTFRLPADRAVGAAVDPARADH
jgi:cyanate permease